MITESTEDTIIVLTQSKKESVEEYLQNFKSL